MKKNLTNKEALKLEESEIKYRRLFESAHDGILILNSQTGQITEVNPFLERLLGYSKDEFLEKKLWEVGAFKNMKAAKDVFKILQKEGYVRYDDLPLETKEGKLISVEFVCNSYLAGGTVVVQCNIRDITERKRIESIKESKRLLEEERLKVESIADTAHELRTPLAIMKGNVDLAIFRGKKSPSSALRAINYEIKHLTSILKDLSLITSKAWESKNKIIYEKVNLRSLVLSAIKRCNVLAYDKKIHLTSTNIPNIIILGDKGYLEKMLINLIKNSIVYGIKNGYTRITAKQTDGFVKIDITDNGIGISKEDLPHIFERFYKVEKFQKSSANSVGLGLAIVKWVVDLHDGTISVTSANKNTVFSISLPIKK
jgi:PAS domain S-box-containing protein